MSVSSSPSYNGRFAELYDLFYSDKNYNAEAEFISARFRGSTAQPVQLLEMACGTGNHTMPLVARGFQVTAIDLSSDMISCAIRKSEEHNFSASFQAMNMMELAFSDASFDGAICLFDSLGYLLENDCIIRCLQEVKRVLKPGASFLFEFWHAPTMLRKFDPVRVRRWVTPGGEITRISETTIDYAKNQAEVLYTIVESCIDGSCRTWKEAHHNRFFSVPEMSLLVQTSGLQAVAWYSGFSLEERIGTDSWHVIGLARVP